MAAMLIKRCAVGYGLLVALAGGGFAFANVFGFAATAISFGGESAADALPIKLWMNVGWVFGVCVVLLGAAMQYRKKKSKTSHNATSSVNPEKKVPPSSKGARRGLLVSAAWGGFFGALIGAVIGVTFVILWFSITYSPFASEDWVASVTVGRQPVGASRREEPVSMTDHPVGLYAFGLPVVLGALGGAVFGGVVRVSEE